MDVARYLATWASNAREALRNRDQAIKTLHSQGIHPRKIAQIAELTEADVKRILGIR